MESPRDLVRKTRATRYYRTANGKLQKEDNKEVTSHDFVIAQAIEYKKVRGRRQNPAIHAINTGPKTTAEMRNARDKINERSSRPKRIFPAIDLSATAVPRPNKIKSKKHLGKPRNPMRQCELPCSTYFHTFIYNFSISAFVSQRRTTRQR